MCLAVKKINTFKTFGSIILWCLGGVMAAFGIFLLVCNFLYDGGIYPNFRGLANNSFILKKIILAHLGILL